MSVSVGRRILTRFCKTHLRELSARTRAVRFNSTANEKCSNLEDNAKAIKPASEANKITAAVLQRTVNPFTIENLELPKVSRADEVSFKLKKFIFLT